MLARQGGRGAVERARGGACVRGSGELKGGKAGAEEGRGGGAGQICGRGADLARGHGEGEGVVRDGGRKSERRVGSKGTPGVARNRSAWGA